MSTYRNQDAIRPPTMRSMTTIPMPASGLRKDATVIGLVGLAHGISHFSQLLLAPLFPWLKEAFAVSYVERGPETWLLKFTRQQ